MSDTTAFVNAINHHLSPSRRDHSLRVATMAKRLAAHYDVNSFECEVAGILHDIAKESNPSQLLNSGVRLSERTTGVTSEYFPIWHQYAGVDLVDHYFPHLPDSIRHAIASHTTGEPNMPIISQIIAVADAIEPGRQHSSRAELETIAFHDLDIATASWLASSIVSLTRKPAPIHANTINAYNFYLSKIGRINAKVVAHLLNTS